MMRLVGGTPKPTICRTNDTVVLVLVLARLEPVRSESALRKRSFGLDRFPMHVNTTLEEKAPNRVLDFSSDT